MPTNVQLNTTLAELDDSLRDLLKRDLARHGLEVQIAFDAPDKEWSAALGTPTINAFLYDIRQAKDHHPVEWEVEKAKNGTRESRPPLMLEASYALSAWARAVEDEHRLLSQVVAILYAYPQLPDDVLGGSLVNQPYPLTTKVAQPKADGKADFWSSIGGTYKASVDYSVTLACESGTTVERGPEVRTQTVRARSIDGPRATVVEMHRAGGTVHTADREPIANAWIALPDPGRWTASGQDGRFRFDRLTAGTYRCLVRTLDGREAHADLVVPGHGADVTVGAESHRPGRKR
jgi:Pvc16 N-terminal domain